MRTLTVLYDETCAFCVRCAQWLGSQERYVRLELLPAGGPEATRRYAGLRRAQRMELLAVDDEGGVYRDDDAWLVCLWALVEYRPWARRLASPALRPLARGAFKLLSSNRKRVSRWLWHSADDVMAHGLREEEKAAARCDGGACGPTAA
jgi:predicted DCC family thiol-disulfide oxidoreductase YuxK